MKRSISEVDVEEVICRKQVRERFDEEELECLSRSIREHGVLQPILVHREGEALVLDDGERRLRAAKRAGLATVPVLIDGRALTPVEMIQRQLVANCQRQDLSSLERARAISRLIQESKWTAAEVATKLGISPASVSRALALLTLPEAIQARVDAGELAASTAYQIARSGEAAPVQETLAAQAAAGELTRDVVATRRRTTHGKARAVASSARVVAPLEGGYSVTVSGPGIDSLDRYVEILEELLGKARKARPRKLELQTFVALLKDEAKATKEAGA